MVSEHASSSHSLPNIPTLPPIQIPCDGDDQIETPLHESPDPYLPPVTLTAPQSTSSVASSPVVMRNSPLSTSSSLVDHLQQNLRKSVSVDSLLAYPPENSPRPSLLGSTRSNLPGVIDSARNRRTELPVDSRRRHEPETVPPYARNRGHSVSTMNDSRDSTIEQDSIKGNEQARLPRRPGDLKLPSRNQPLPPPVPPPLPVNTFARLVQPVLHDDSRRLHSTTSLQSFPRHSSIADVMAGRVRSGSGSLGLQVGTGNFSNQGLHIDTVRSTSVSRELSIAVVGTRGCGKSTFISGDAQAHGANCAPLFMKSGSSATIPFRYTRRLDWLERESSYHSVTTLELDIERITAPPRVDGIFVCYDSGDASSFAPVPDFLQSIHSLKYSVVAVALKSDREAAVDRDSLNIFEQYDVRLVQVSNNEEGSMQMRRAFQLLLMSLLSISNPDLRKPVSPAGLGPPILWDTRGSAVITRTASSSAVSIHTTSQTSQLSPSSTLPTSPPPFSSSPSRARSTSDLHIEHERVKSRGSEEHRLSNARSINNLASITNVQSGPILSLQQATESATNGHDHDERPVFREKEGRSVQYATLEELLDKLLFLAVSGDDPTFISHFLLTYRRFATPRSILLAMQKRMRQLENSLGDPMFASYAQMRICHLLETWIDSYSHDFAVPGASGALNALVKSIIAKTCLLHYGSDFLPFQEKIHTKVDTDAAWALKSEPLLDETDDSYSISDGEDDTLGTEVPELASASRSSVTPSQETFASVTSRERKQSLPLSGKVLIKPVPAPLAEIPVIPPKQLLKELMRQSQELQNYDCSDIAEEITRIEAKLFMAIEPRHWLRYAFVPGRKDPESDTIARFNATSNYLASWVGSLILCHDKPRNRAKQIEKFVDIAHKLRALNNYSALRAFVAGIHNSTFQGDETLEQFRNKAPAHHKNLLSWDVLLQHRGAHQAYRMALKNTKGACIPALEVHMSDLIRAHEGNPDFGVTEPNKVHWGKFNMLGRFIHTTTQCQLQCQLTPDYNFPDRLKIRDLVFNDFVMSEELQLSRMAPLPDAGLDEPLKSARSFSRVMHNFHIGGIIP